MVERLRNIDGESILSPEPDGHQEISLKDEVRNPNPALDKTPNILDRILSSPTSRHITHTSGPNSR